MNLTISHRLYIAVIVVALLASAVILLQKQTIPSKPQATENEIALPVQDTNLVDATQVEDPKTPGATSDAIISLDGIENDFIARAIIPPDDYPSILKWSGRHFIHATDYLTSPNSLSDPINKIPVEIYDPQLTADSIDSVRTILRKIIIAQSTASFDDFLSERGGPAALATEATSPYALETFGNLKETIQKSFPGINPPKTLMDAYRILWEQAYKGSPYMDMVSFDGAFIAFYRLSELQFNARKWAPMGDEGSNALQDEAVRRGSLSGTNLYRVLENRRTPADVVASTRELHYVDFLMTTGAKKKLSFPLMFRYYYDPGGRQWLQAFYCVFYNKLIVGTEGRTFLN